MAASRLPQLSCAISFYGQLRYAELSDNKPVSPIDTVEELGCPLLGHFGEADPLVSVEHVMELQKRVQGQPAEIYTYPGAGHAFHEDFPAPGVPAGGRHHRVGPHHDVPGLVPAGRSPEN